MGKTLTKLSRILPMAVFMGVANVAVAQVEVVATAGEATDTYSYTMGEAFVSENAGTWATTYEVLVSVPNVYAGKEVQVATTGDGNITVTVPEELLREGAYYCICDMSGRLLGRCDMASTTVKCHSVMANSTVILTVNTKKRGVVSTFKLIK